MTTVCSAHSDGASSPLAGKGGISVIAAGRSLSPRPLLSSRLFLDNQDTSYSWGAPRHTPGTLVPIILARLRVTACSFPDLSHCYP